MIDALSSTVGTAVAAGKLFGGFKASKFGAARCKAAFQFPISSFTFPVFLAGSDRTLFNFDNTITFVFELGAAMIVSSYQARL